MPIENTEEFVCIPADGVTLEGDLVLSKAASGIVVFGVSVLFLKNHTRYDRGTHGQ